MEWDRIIRNKFRQKTGALHETAMIVYLVFRSMINLNLFNLHFLEKKKTLAFTNQPVINHLPY